MARRLWDLQKGIEEWDKIPDDDSEDDDISAEINTERSTVKDNTNLELRCEVENRIKLYGTKLCTNNYKLLTILSEKISNRHMGLLTELFDCDYSSFNDKIKHEYGKQNCNYMSLLEAGLQYISQTDPEKITWRNVLTALMKIPEWSIIKSLLEPELDEYWTKLNDENKAKETTSCSKPNPLLGSVSKAKEPVESLELDTRLQNFGISNSRSINDSPTNDAQDSGIASSSSSPDQAISNAFTNLAINTGRDGSNANPSSDQIQVPVVQASSSAAIPQNQHAGTVFSMGNPAGQQQQPQLPSFANQTNFSISAHQQCLMFNGMPSMFPSSGQNFYSIPIQPFPMQMCQWPMMPVYPSPVNNAVNNAIQNSIQSNENCLQPRCTPAPSTSSLVTASEEDNVELKVLLTYSNDANEIALKVQERLWYDYSIVAMTQKDLQNRMQHSLGNDVVNRCNQAKYIVPILSKKYIADIGYGHLLGNDCNLSYNDEDLEDKNLVESIYSQYVNMCFANGGRNAKVRPVCVMNNSFSVRSQLVPCLSNAWNLWSDFKVFATVILR